MRIFTQEDRQKAQAIVDLLAERLPPAESMAGFTASEIIEALNQKNNDESTGRPS